MNIQHFFDPKTFTLTYLVYDPDSLDAIIIDPVLNYDMETKTYSTESLQALLGVIQSHSLNPLAIIETHVHADHLSSSQWIKKEYPQIQIIVSDAITQVQQIFKDEQVLTASFNANGSQFDHLVKDKDRFSVGSISVDAIHTPGHTLACCSYLIEDVVFVGDTLFMPDSGVGRCDFPGGSAETLFHSIQEKLYRLPDETRVFVGHDYQPNGRPLAFETSIKEEKAHNIHLNAQTQKNEFIDFRTTRDQELSPPKLLIPSLKVNLSAGDYQQLS